jgi:hypothetical protein
MASADTYTEYLGANALAHRPAEATRRSAGERSREQRLGRKEARLVSADGRRELARRLRRTAQLATDQDPIRRRGDVLLHHRAAAVRDDLLEIAARLERSCSPDPACVVALHRLLADGCASPLYNPRVSVIELDATLGYAKETLRAASVARRARVKERLAARYGS